MEAKIVALEAKVVALEAGVAALAAEVAAPEVAGQEVTARDRPGRTAIYHVAAGVGSV